MKVNYILPTARRVVLAKKRIEIVVSGKPRLSAMSSKSQQSVIAILKAHYTDVAITTINNLADLEKLVAREPDLVILGTKFMLQNPSLGYAHSPKLWLSNYLDANDINFSGSDSVALRLEYYKHDAKQRIIEADLNSSAFFMSDVNLPTFDHDLSYPLFVKPANLGGSKGIDEKSVVNTDLELRAKIMSVHNDFYSNALIEEYLPGREFSVAVIERPESRALRAMPIEIVSPADNKGNRYLGKSVKKADAEKTIAVTDPILKDRINRFAIDVFNALGARDYGRIDLRIDRHGSPSFIEANLMPGLSDHGYLSRCFYLNAQMSYGEMILAIAELGLKRNLGLIGAVEPTPQLAFVD